MKDNYKVGDRLMVWAVNSHYYSNSKDTELTLPSKVPNAYSYNDRSIVVPNRHSSLKDCPVLLEFTGQIAGIGVETYWKVVTE